MSFKPLSQLDRIIDIDMADKNTSGNATIIDQSVDPRLIQIRNDDIQRADEDERQTPKVYHFQNCGMVYVDSLNARNVAIENCGNHDPQVTYYRPRTIGPEKSDKVLHSQSRAVANDPSPRTSKTEISISVDYLVLFSWAVFVAIMCLAFFTINLPRLCGIWEGTPRM